MKESSALLASLIETREIPVVVIDRDYAIVAANRLYCESYGIASNMVVGKRCHEVLRQSDVPCHLNGEQCPHREVFSTGQPCEILHTNYDPLNRPDIVRISAHPLRDNAGNLYLMESIRRLSQVDCCGSNPKKMIGKSPAFLACLENLMAAARSETAIVLQGESGVGKELAARFIHDNSAGSARPFVELNCASIPEQLFESELFGYERGAFTGSVGSKRGLFEMADGGTLFLDEIGEMPLSMQAKLLRVLDSGQFRRVGGHTLHHADVRVVAATNRNLMTMVSEGTFRSDLYFRIASINIAIPPLRERRNDIPELAEAIIRNKCAKGGGECCRLGQDVLNRLMSYDYPGNVRELRNVLARAIAMDPNGLVQARHIQFDYETRPRQPAMVEGAADILVRTNDYGWARRSRKDVIEPQHISALLNQHSHNRRVVANVLGISERTLYRKLKQFRLLDQEA